MPFDLNDLRIERLNVEVAYHATYTFYGLKGVIAERWAHGPIFGAVGEVGTNQLNLTPEAVESDERLVAVVGMRVSGFLAEGTAWTERAPNIAAEWFNDIFTVLKPRRTVRYRAEVVAIHPIREPHAPTRRLIDRFYARDELLNLAGSDRSFAAVEILNTEEVPHKTIVIGVIGPPHRGSIFNFENQARDDHWWMGVRVNLGAADEEGIADPLDAVQASVDKGYAEVNRIARSVLPELVGD